MNVFFVIVLAALLLDFVIGLVADLLNLRALKLEPPPDLKGIYPPEEYRRSQQYVRTNTRFGIYTGAFRMAVLLVFWFAGGFNFLDEAVRAWGFGSLVNGLLYTGLLVIGSSVLSLPFGAYATFVIEERFGFNRTTPRTFALDHVKGLALAVLLGGPLLAAVLWLFMYAGAYAWLYAWAAIILFSLAVQYIAPTWIMPLFNKFTPLPDGELRQAILDYARSVRFPVRNVLVMDGSRRSSKSNAFFIGFGKNKRIALFDTLISRHTVPEMVAVLAHEIGHYRKKHIIQGTVISILHSGLVLYLLTLFLGSPGLYQAFGMAAASVYAGLVFFGLLYTPVEMVLSLALHALSRRNESEADRFAARTTEEPLSLAEALKKLAANNLSNLTPHPFYAFLNYSHPPLRERLRAIEQHAAQQGD
ncbi:MAG: M48 family metallopeptidase [Chloroflexi bacterium]|nr:M48 family metallopeptidase [Chloroflexota bacterium]